MNEPLPAEYPYLRKQKMFTHFHLAGVTPTLIRQFLERRTTAIVYEIVENAADKVTFFLCYSDAPVHFITLSLYARVYRSAIQ